MATKPKSAGAEKSKSDASKSSTTKAPASKSTAAKPAASKSSGSKSTEGKSSASKAKDKPEGKAKSTRTSSKAAGSGNGAKKAGTGRRGGGAISQPVTPSKQLAEVVGGEARPRGEVVSRIWDYIKSHKLQNPDDGREIIADAKLEAVFGKKKATMFEMNKLLAAHLK